MWNVDFIGSDITYTYKNENVQVIKNCLKDKQSAAVFDYLLQMAQFSELKNDDGQKLLVKNLEKTKFINEHSVLSRYLNPKLKFANPEEKSSLIFPFGCNNSQFKAVKTALNNQISIIQGPPGTGKTQTILNIIANLLNDSKTVLVVSNNNDATANVYEKLSSEKYGLDFVCAPIGQRKNVAAFLQNQKQCYPEYVDEWKKIIPTFQTLFDKEVKNLENYFDNQERMAEITSELSALKIEKKYYEANTIDELYKSEKLEKLEAKTLLELLQKLQFKYNHTEKLGFFCKWNLKSKYGLGTRQFWKTESNRVFGTLKSAYYILKTKELVREYNDRLLRFKDFSPEEVYKKSLNYLKLAIYKKYSKNNGRHHFKDSKEMYFNPGIFAAEYPVILSTTFSSRAAIGAANDFLFDYVIMDEASQVDVVTGAIALSCAKNAVIVGDKMQLPNVIAENKKPVIQELFNQTKLPQGYSFLYCFLISLEQILPETPQTLLKEHYRCHPKIINFCNQQFYGGKLLIMTEDKDEQNVLQVIKTVPGTFCSNRYNQRQIDIIKADILPMYTQKEIDSLGIIAPYNNQTDQIGQQIPGIDASTVHKYQGREKDTIIISTVDDEITPFSDDSNILNVAISRAKKKLAVVISGNEQPANSNLAALIKYIQYNNFEITESKMQSVFDFLYSKISFSKFEYLLAAKKISKFDSENVMNALLTEILEAPEYCTYGFVFELPLKEIVSRSYLQQLPEDLAEYANHDWSHVDFTVFNKVTKEIMFGIEVDGYNYHKKGTKQAIRDRMKNQIFEIIGLPLLRLGTKGSEEEKKIKDLLAKYI